MKEPLKVADSPCASCPYRKDVPSGVWAKSEYVKLPGYDDGPQGQTEFAPFLCHHSPAIGEEYACRGWLSVHCQSAAVRLLMYTELVTEEQVFAKPTVPLFASGAEAAEHGMREIRRPSEAAIAMADKLRLMRKKARRVARRKSRK